MSPREGCGKRFWLAQKRAEVLPDQRVELAGGRVARRTTGGAVREGAVSFAVTQVVEVVLVDRTRGASQAAAPAAHQGAQQILVRRVIPPGKGAVHRQLGLHLIE